MEQHLIDNYIRLEKDSGLKEGDKVKIIRKAISHENGWNNAWISLMDYDVGKTVTIRAISKYGSGIGFKEIGCSYPFFILEKIDNIKLISLDKKEIIINGEKFFLPEAIISKIKEEQL